MRIVALDRSGFAAESQPVAGNLAHPAKDAVRMWRFFTIRAEPESTAMRVIASPERVAAVLAFGPLRQQDRADGTV